MEKFRIVSREGDDYITNLEHNFTLKVIPPGKQPDGYALGRQVVGVDFCSFTDRLTLGLSEEAGYDFESLDNGYYDDDCKNCNKELWFETIEYYCQLVLDREPVGYTAYNYDYDLTEENCSPECWTALGGTTKIAEQDELPF
jgi:hypothetical protein